MLLTASIVRRPPGDWRATKHDAHCVKIIIIMSESIYNLLISTGHVFSKWLTSNNLQFTVYAECVKSVVIQQTCLYSSSSRECLSVIVAKPIGNCKLLNRKPSAVKALFRDATDLRIGLRKMVHVKVESFGCACVRVFDGAWDGCWNLTLYDMLSFVDWIIVFLCKQSGSQAVYVTILAIVTNWPVGF